MNCRQCGTTTEDYADGLCAGCAILRTFPDPLSEQKTIAGKPFADLKQVDEADRFKQIAHHLRANSGKIIGVLVDSGPAYEGKAERYIASIKSELPKVRFLDRKPFKPGSELLRFILDP